MKGIAHFLTGVTAASFFPWSIEQALDGNPVYFVLGGAFGLLPDTIDFKFYRFFYPHDVYIEPVPSDSHPQPIADRIAEAMATALREQRVIRVKLGTIRLGADRWRQYRLRFDAERREVQVQFGPTVTTGQMPIPGTTPSTPLVARAPLPAPVIQTYDAETTVDILDGPTFGLEPESGERIVLHFLPWHRNWSHSLLVGAFFAALAVLAGAWRAGMVIFVAYAGHLLEDQLGFMGSNLFFPLTRRRFPGAHMMRSGDTLPNFLTVWTCCLLIFWNLYRRTPDPLVSIGFFKFLFYAGVLPLLIMLVIRRLTRRGAPRPPERVDTSKEWSDPLIS